MLNGIMYLRRGALASAILMAVIFLIALAPRAAKSADNPKRVAFIFTSEPDGANPRFLVASPQMTWNGSPAWSHDGKMVAFDANPGSFSSAHLFIYAAGGPFKGALKDLGFGSAPCWSPDDNQIAYFLHDGNPDSAPAGVWIVSTDGTNRRWLCQGERSDWSPDGSKLLVGTKNGQVAALDVVNVNTGEGKRLIEGTYETIPGGAWSPDGKKIAFVGFRHYSTRESELVVMNAGGPVESSQVLLRGRIGWQPHWSPDGAKLAFTMWQPSGVEHSYIINVEGDHTPQKLENQEPGIKTVEVQWSGDGKRLVFSRDR
jgi:Tol biopolymer transport system component